MTRKQAEFIAKCVENELLKALTDGRISATITKEWDESKHVRDEHGRFVAFNNSTPEQFVNAINVAKAGCDESIQWRVDAHSAEDYGNADAYGNKAALYVSKGGSCVAVTPDGDIISVCKNTKGEKDLKNIEKTSGTGLISMAVQMGGNKLDSFAGNHVFYNKCGFEPVSWTPFSKDYAPEGWKPGMDEEPVIFYKYTGNTEPISLDSFLSSNPPYEGEDGYDNAMAARDKSM